MFGGEHHISRPIKCVRSGREDANGSVSVPLAFYGLQASGLRHPKIDFRAFTAADPISLEQLNSFRPIESLEFVDQSLRVSSDA